MVALGSPLVVCSDLLQGDSEKQTTGEVGPATGPHPASPSSPGLKGGLKGQAPFSYTSKSAHFSPLCPISVTRTLAVPVSPV